MFDNFFNLSVKKKLINRLDFLTENSTPIWGKMTANEMICHLSDQLKLAIGIRTSPLEGLFIFKNQLAILLALYIVPWRKGKETSPTYMNKDINGTQTTDFNKDKEQFLSLLEEFYTHKNKIFYPHPLFGNFTNHQWGRMIAKHMNHHLNQFGV